MLCVISMMTSYRVSQAYVVNEAVYDIETHCSSIKLNIGIIAVQNDQKHPVNALVK